MRLRLEAAIVDRLRRGDRERYVLGAKDAMPLARILESTLRGPNAVAEVIRALALSVALERYLESPSAAESVRALLRSEPSAVRLLRATVLARTDFDEAQRFLDREGRAEPRLAPMFERSRPANTIKLSAFLNPGGPTCPTRTSAARPTPIESIEPRGRPKPPATTRRRSDP
jgi:hypothetical protein